MFTPQEIELALRVLAVTTPTDAARKVASDLIAHHLTDTITAAAQRVVDKNETETK